MGKVSVSSEFDIGQESEKPEKDVSLEIDGW